MNWGNAIVTIIHQDKNGQIPSINSDGGSRTTEKKLAWLAIGQRFSSIKLISFEHLLAKDKLSRAEEQDETVWQKFVTPQIEFKTTAVADCNIQDVKVDDGVQFDRKGYFRCDRALTLDEPGVFFRIPTGKEQVSVRRV